VAALATIALVGPGAGVASAHALSVTLTCENGLKVDLRAYNGTNPNTVSVSIDGVAVEGSPFSFGTTFLRSWPVTPATVTHTAEVVIVAWDDPTGSKGWSRTYNLSLPVCEAPPTEEPTTPPTEPPTEEPTEEPTTPPTEPPTEPPADQAELIVYKGLDIDGDGDPNTGEILPGEGWTFDVEVTGGTVVDSLNPTDEDGMAAFLFDVEGEGVMVDVAEQLLEDYEFLGAICLLDEEVEVGTVGEAEVTDVPIAAGQTVECWFVNTSGGEEPATATPKQVTPPPTATVDFTGGSGSDSWRIVLLGIAALLASLLLFTPAERAVSRRRR
jgi:hypothetical protein